MSALISNLTLFFTWVIQRSTELVAYVSETPALVIMVIGFAVTGFVVGILSRLFRT